MEVLTRWFSAIMAVLMGLPLLFSAVLQSATKTGYDGRPTEEIRKNFLEGSECFIDEAVSEFWSAGFSKKALLPQILIKQDIFSEVISNSLLRK